MGRTARGHTPAEHDGEIPPPPGSQQTAGSGTPGVMQDTLAMLRVGSVTEDERRALLDALNAVPPVCELCDHQHAPMVCVPCHNRTADRAERAERERDVLRADNDHLREALRKHGVHRGASRPSPSPCDLYTGKGKCSCGLAEALSADAEPFRPGAMDCGHDSINYSYVLGQCRACDVEHAEPSRAEGDEHPFEMVDIPEAIDPNMCWRCGEDRSHPSHRDPREGLDPDERNVPDAAGGRPREADPQGDSPSTGASVDGGSDDGRSRAIDYYEGVRQGLSFARDAVVGVMGMYPEEVFTEDGTTPDAIAARMARHVCQVILDGLVFDEGCESQGCVLPYKHEGGCEY